MKPFSTLVKIYLAVGTAISIWFFVAAASGWKAPNFGILDGSSSRNSSRSFGGYWGGGK